MWIAIRFVRVHDISLLWFAGLSSNQGEKSINLCFIMVSLRKKY